MKHKYSRRKRAIRILLEWLLVLYLFNIFEAWALFRGWTTTGIRNYTLQWQIVPWRIPSNKRRFLQVSQHEAKMLGTFPECDFNSLFFDFYCFTHHLDHCYFCFRMMLNAVDCVKKAATAACGKEAAEHQVRKEKLYIQPLADEIHCNLDPKKGEYSCWKFQEGKRHNRF